MYKYDLVHCKQRLLSKDYAEHFSEYDKFKLTIDNKSRQLHSSGYAT